MNKELKNPFEALTKKGQDRTLKYCAWEVLRDHPRGLHVSQIVREIHNRGLKDFSKKKNASGQVAGELVRDKDVFWHDPHRRLWWIRCLAPVPNEDPSGGPLPHGEDLVGHRVAVWWEGDQQFYDGIFLSYDSETNTYSVDYDDGDDDPCIELRKYKVDYKDERISVVTVLEHNLDGTDEDETSAASAEDSGRKLATDGGSLVESGQSKSSDGRSSQLQRENNNKKKKKKKPKKTIHSSTSNQAKIEREGSGSETDGLLNQRKRKISPSETEAEVKKSKTGFTSETVEDGNLKDPVSEHIEALNQSPNKTSRIQSLDPYQHPHHDELKEDPPVAGIGSHPKGAHSKNRAVEMIDVLDLTKQLKPPEDKRPDIKNLTDLGELMSLTELSNELRALDDGFDMEDEVTSKYKPTTTTTTTESRGNIDDQQPSSNPDQGSPHDTDDRETGFLEKVPCYKDFVSGNVESRLLTSLGSNGAPTGSDEIKRIDNLVANRRDSILCSPPVLSRAPRL